MMLKKNKIFYIINLLINKYKIPIKYFSSILIRSYFGYKIKKKNSHNAIHDCILILRALRKIRFDLNFTKK